MRQFLVRHPTAATWTVSLSAAAAVTFSHIVLGYKLANPRMVTQPWLLRQGFVPYLHIADQKMPLLPQSLAWLSTLWQGDMMATLLFAHAAVLFATVLVSVHWAARQGGLLAGAGAALFFLAWSGVFGFWALYYDLVLGLLYVVLFVLLSRPQDSQSGVTLFAAGAVCGAALLVKQHAVFLVAPIVYWLYLQVHADRRLTRQAAVRAALFCVGFALVAGAYFAYYSAQASTWTEWVYWTVTYNLTGDYATQGVRLPSSQDLWRIAPALALPVMFGVGVVATPRGQRGARRSLLVWLLLFTVIALVPLYPRFSPRHLATVAPFLAMLSGLSVAQWAGTSRGTSPSRHTGWALQAGRLFVAALVVLWAIAAIRVLNVRLTGPSAGQFGEYDNLRPLAAELDRNLPAHAELVIFPDDEATANLYYLLERTPPPYWLLHYPWMLTPRSVQAWLDAVEDAQPQTVVYFPLRGDPQADGRLRNYVLEHYITTAELSWEGETVELMQLRE